MLTETKFWHMILHTKNEKEGQHSYMVKYWPKLKIALIKAASKGEAQNEADNKRKKELQERANED
eukprot:8911824-Heterocapsa_arctica.AAC.1